jgi:hypothetical protein
MMEHPRRIALHVLPALPGYDKIDLCTDDHDDQSMFFTPVIAWIVHVYEVGEKGSEHHEAEGSHALPVCADQVFYGDGCDAIRRPDGSIVISGDCTFPKGEEAAALERLVMLGKKQKERLASRTA